MEPYHSNNGPKVAIVHDWLIDIGGSEKVVSQLLELYPEAELYTVLDFFGKGNRKKLLKGKNSHNTFLQYIPFSKRYYRYLIPFFYRSVEQFKLEGYDLIISSSHSISKGVKTTDYQTHICYCHTPMRYVWNMKKTYLQYIPFVFRPMAARQLRRMKNWDEQSNERVNYFIANSSFIAERINKNYNRSSTVIHPPVDDQFFSLPDDPVQIHKRETYYLVVSRLVQYKKVDLIVKAFNEMPEHRLIVIGTGPQSNYLEKIAGENVDLLGYQSRESVREYMQNAKALVLVAIEDFGITSLEAQACGTPVLALNYGGYRDSVQEDVSGMFFEEQTVDSLKKGVMEFEKKKGQFDPYLIRKAAESFSNSNFQRKVRDFINTHIK